MNTKKNIRACNEIETLVHNTDAVFIIVPTPSGADYKFSNEFVLNAVNSVGEALKSRIRDGFFVVNIVSTVMPGSTGGIIKTTLEATSSLQVGVDIGLTYNPEFIALGSVIRDMYYPDVTLIGADDYESGARILEVYRKIVKRPTHEAVLSLIDAEITKIAINTFVTNKIAFANSIGVIADQFEGANAYAICSAVGNDSRVGSKYFRPGAPFGGPCFPRDGRAFASLSNIPAGSELFSCISRMNDYQTEYFISKILNEIKTGTVHLVGMSYKPGTPVVEESFGVELYKALLDHSIKVTFSDENVHHLDIEGVVHTRSNIEASYNGLIVNLLPSTKDQMDQLVNYYRDAKILDLWSL